VSDRDSQDHIGVVESFTTGANLEVLSVRLDDSAVGCDKDGVLDQGETGVLTVTVRNTGSMDLPAFTGTVASNNTTATVDFPSGNTLSFRALKPNQTATATVRVALTALSSPDTATAGLSITLNEPSLPQSAKTLSYDPRVHYDMALGGSTTDTAETALTTLESTMIGPNAAWKAMGQPGSRYYHVDNPATVRDLAFTTPWLQVAPSGNFTFSFKHRYSFESDNAAAPFWDGGLIEVSTDGIRWTDLFDLGIAAGYVNYMETAANGNDSPLAGRAGYVGLSTGFPNWLTRTVNLGTLFAGQKVRVRFRTGSDGGVGAYGWDVDDLTFNNIVNTPFPRMVTETSDGTVCNQRPVAHPGAGQTQAEGTLAQGELTRTVINLDGSGSFDPDGQPLSYAWTQVAGPAVTLSGADSARPTFTADVSANTTLAFQLVVSDGMESSQPQTVQVRVNNVNRPPKALANAQATVDERSGLVVTLDGSGSMDADGEQLTYTWAQVNGPEVVLANATKAAASFEPPEVSANSQLTFSLTVSDGVASATNTVAVTVNNVDRAPVANAGEDMQVAARSAVTLTGTATDVDGDDVTYAWTQVDGTPVTLTGADTATLKFNAPDVRQSTVLVFKLVATAKGLESEDTVTVTVQKANRRPVVLAGTNVLEENERTPITLTAAGSDEDGDTLTYAWEQVGGPTVTLSGADTANLSFTTPEVLGNTVLNFRLHVKDPDQAESESVLVSLTVKDVNRAPVSKPRKVAGSYENQTITLDASASVDPDGEALTYKWEQTDGPAVTLTAPNEALTAFTPTDISGPTNFTFSLTVTDSRGMTSAETVKVTVLHVEAPKTEAGGCSSTGSGSGSMMSLLLLVGGLVLSRRRQTGRAS
jgi:uncharacterized protein (TIGR03382 family)